MKQIRLSMQQFIIAKEMKSRKFITSASCFTCGGGLKLTTRLGELRNLGFIIGQIWIRKTDTSNGHNVYWLKKIPKGIIL